MTTLYRKMAGGAAWMVSFQLASQLVSFISTLILARVLMPDDFGLIAISFSLIALVELIGAFGLHITLIQRPDVAKSHYDTAWTMRLIVNTAAALIVITIADYAAKFVDEPRLTNVVYLLSLTFVIDAFSNIGVVEFQRRMQFHKDFLYMLGPKLVGFATTIPLAFTFRTYWVLVAGAIAARIAALALSYLMHPMRPRPTLSRASDFYHMSKWLIVNNILSFVWIHVPALLLGRLSTTRSVGFFKVSFEIANLPTTQLVGPINRAVFPGYAQISGDAEKLAKAFLDVVQMISLIILPIGVGIAAVAEIAVPLLLGGKWTEAIPIVRTLAIAAAVSCMLINTSSVYMSIERPQLVTAYLGAKVGFLFAAMLMLAPENGALGVAWAALLAEGAMLPIGIYMLKRTIGITFGGYIRYVSRAAIASAVMFGTVRFIYAAWPPGSDTFTEQLWHLLVLVVAGASTYLTAVFAMWRLAGRPEGGESVAVDWLAGHLTNSRETTRKQ